jgi:hypothetical protein
MCITRAYSYDPILYNAQQLFCLVMEICETTPDMESLNIWHLQNEKLK